MDKMRYDYSDEDNSYTRLKAGRPLNETDEHFFCKNVGQVFLFHNHNCRYIGTEIDNCWHMEPSIAGASGTKYYGSRRKNIIDVIGMTRKFQLYGVEAKASLSDYRNGFCACMPYTYIICPKDVIPPDDLPKGIGLVYVDIPNFHIVGYDDVRGLKVVKSARKRIDPRWINPTTNKFDDKAFEYCRNRWYNDICFRNSIKNVFNRTNIPIYRKE